MILRTFLFVNLIILSFSLEETITLYKAMSELNPPLQQQDICRFKMKTDDNEILYVKPCEEGFHCGNDFHDISTCIPNYIGQKVGETCNYKDECLLRECDSKTKKCTSDEPVYVDINWSYRCANGLFYDKDKEKCINIEKKDLLDGYCTYTKKGEDKEVNIEPNKPFYVCGESGITTDKDSQLELNTRYTKITKIGSLPLGATTITEYACQSGVVSKSTVQDFWICDKITAIKTGTEDGKKYVIYSFQIHGDEKIYEDNYDGAYFYLNQLTGEIQPYGFDYQNSFAKYMELLPIYEKSCIENSHDYYFRPFDCGIKELSDVTFFFNNEYFFNTKNKEAEIVKNYLLNQNIYTKFSPSKASSSFKKSLFMLLIFLGLL